MLNCPWKPFLSLHSVVLLTGRIYRRYQNIPVFPAGDFSWRVKLDLFHRQAGGRDDSRSSVSVTLCGELCRGAGSLIPRASEADWTTSSSENDVFLAQCMQVNIFRHVEAPVIRILKYPASTPCVVILTPGWSVCWVPTQRFTSSRFLTHNLSLPVPSPASLGSFIEM